VWRNATVSFGEVATDHLNQQFFHAIGTGIIVSTDSHTGYLVTARHMFCDAEKDFHPSQLRIRFAWQDRKSIYRYFGITLNLRAKNGADLWSSLDDDSDVAAIAVPAIVGDLPEEDRLKSYDSVSIQDIVSDPFEGESVWVLGYPGIVGNEQLVKAIVRQGMVAWTSPDHPEDNPFLIDANLYPGNSGGPVIQLPVGFKKDGSIDYLSGGHFKLLGIVSKAPMEDIKTTVVNPRLGQVETHTPIVGIGAIGVIEPGSKIRKLITMIQNQTTKTPVCDVYEPKKREAAPAH
jgi:hypothetical protein